MTMTRMDSDAKPIAEFKWEVSKQIDYEEIEVRAEQATHLPTPESAREIVGSAHHSVLAMCKGYHCGCRPAAAAFAHAAE